MTDFGRALGALVLFSTFLMVVSGLIKLACSGRREKNYYQDLRCKHCGNISRFIKYCSSCGRRM